MLPRVVDTLANDLHVICKETMKNVGYTGLQEEEALIAKDKLVNVTIARMGYLLWLVLLGPCWIYAERNLMLKTFFRWKSRKLLHSQP